VFSRKANVARTSLARSLLDAVRSWWQHDDIRISPSEGRLLRLEVPCIVEVEQELFEITRRTIGRRGSEKFVTYQGRAAATWCFASHRSLHCLQRPVPIQRPSEARVIRPPF
jgi:hypothetical protein